MEIPSGLSLSEEWEWVRKQQAREAKSVLVEWLMGLAVWETKADLTFESVAHPERAEKAVRRWLKKVAKRSTVVVGYERQERGAVHAHLVIDRRFDYQKAGGLWNKMAGFCRIGAIRSREEAMGYIVKHAVKGLNFEVIGPGRPAWLSQRHLPTPYQILRQLDAERSEATGRLVDG